MCSEFGVCASNYVALEGFCVHMEDKQHVCVCLSVSESTNVFVCVCVCRALTSVWAREIHNGFFSRRQAHGGTQTVPHPPNSYACGEQLYKHNLPL